MDIKELSKVTKKIFPKWLFKHIRSIGTAILTPVVFSCRTGHFKSSLLNKSVNRYGEPIPWYTYPAIEFLMNKNFKGKKILEWGAGHSTLWWAKQADSVVAFESDTKWHDYIKQLSSSNITLQMITDSLDGLEKHFNNDKFDVIIIDGLNRFKCAKISIDLLAENGFIILDNSDGYWGKEGDYPIINLFKEKGFQRIDFYGNSPGVIQSHCTSLFFYNKCFLLRGEENPCLMFK